VKPEIVLTKQQGHKTLHQINTETSRKQKKFGPKSCNRAKHCQCKALNTVCEPSLSEKVTVSVDTELRTEALAATSCGNDSSDGVTSGMRSALTRSNVQYCDV